MNRNAELTRVLQLVTEPTRKWQLTVQDVLLVLDRILEEQNPNSMHSQENKLKFSYLEKVCEYYSCLINRYDNEQIKFYRDVVNYLSERKGLFYFPKPEHFNAYLPKIETIRSLPENENQKQKIIQSLSKIPRLIYSDYLLVNSSLYGKVPELKNDLDQHQEVNAHKPRYFEILQLRAMVKEFKEAAANLEDYFTKIEQEINSKNSDKDDADKENEQHIKNKTTAGKEFLNKLKNEVNNLVKNYSDFSRDKENVKQSFITAMETHYKAAKWDAITTKRGRSSLIGLIEFLMNGILKIFGNNAQKETPFFKFDLNKHFHMRTTTERLLDDVGSSLQRLVAR